MLDPYTNKDHCLLKSLRESLKLGRFLTKLNFSLNAQPDVQILNGLYRGGTQ